MPLIVTRHVVKCLITIGLVVTHPSKFGGRSHCGSGNITYLVSHVTLQEHVVKGSCNFMEGRHCIFVLVWENMGQ